MRGILFGDFEVELDPRSVGPVGGSWTGERRADGLPRAYDPDSLRFFFGKMQELDAPVILDIGANTGSFCLLAKFQLGATGYAFEPAPIPLGILRANIELNGLGERISTLPYALTDSTGAAILKYPLDDHSGLACIGNPLRFGKWDEIEVEARRLDDLKLGRADLMKIDTEGCELLVLRGAERTLRQHKPGILLEFNAANTRQFRYEPQEILEFLGTCGYGDFQQVGKEDLYAC